MKYPYCWKLFVYSNFVQYLEQKSKVDDTWKFWTEFEFFMNDSVFAYNYKAVMANFVPAKIGPRTKFGKQKLVLGPSKNWS